jgi:hypothetical protein
MSTKRAVSSQQISSTVASVGVKKTGLAALANIASKSSSSSNNKPQKWEMPLTPESQLQAQRWIAAKTVLEPVMARVENAKDEFVQYAMSLMTQKLFDNKSKPSNPLVVLRKEDGSIDSTFQFLMTDKFKVKLPEAPVDEDAAEFYATIFSDLGLHPHDANNLVESELDLSPSIEFRSPKELTSGRYGENREWIESTPAEKLAGEKMTALVLWNGQGKAPAALTDEEKALVVVSSASVKIKAGFYDRLSTYCRSVEQVVAVLGLIQPVVYPAYAKFATNDSVTVQAQRKIAAAAEILGG